VDVSEYRRQVEAELEQAAREQVSFRELLAGARESGGGPAAGASAAPGDEDDLTAAVGILRDPDAEPGLRNAALQVVALNIDERPELFDTLLELLRDTSRPIDQRLATLGTLQQIAIRIVGFPEKRPLYLDALRAIVDDPSAALRRQAIAILAREKDEYVQRRLLDGLEKRSKALVPPAKAIQFLGYDVHAEHFPLLRRIVEDPPNRAAKIEALRVLAADPSSGDLLLKVMEDKGESPEVRRVAAVALGSLAPDVAQRHARRIALDDGEDDQLRATALNMLSVFTDPETLSADDELNRCVDRLRAESGSRTVKQASAAFIAKRG
jgi:HEAT repeat protein